MTHSKTKLWKLGVELRERAGLNQSAEAQVEPTQAEGEKRPKRMNFAQTVVGNFGMPPELRAQAQAHVRIEPQRMIVIQAGMPSAEAEQALRSIRRDASELDLRKRETVADLEAHRRQAASELDPREQGTPADLEARKRDAASELEARARFEQVAERARHAAEAWAAGAAIGATTQLYKPDLQALKAGRPDPAARRSVARAKPSSLSVRIPKLGAAAQLSRIRLVLSNLPVRLRAVDRTRLILAIACGVALVWVPFIYLGNAHKAEQTRATEQAQSDVTAATHGEPVHAALAASEPAVAEAAPAASDDAPEQVVAEPVAQHAGPLRAAASSGTTPRAAVDALIAGNPRLAAERYEMLARSYPDHAEFAAAARILHESIERSAGAGEDP